MPHFKRALELKPDFYAVHYQWGLALANQKATGFGSQRMGADGPLRACECRLPCQPRESCFIKKARLTKPLPSSAMSSSCARPAWKTFSNLGLAYAKSGGQAEK